MRGQKLFILGGIIASILLIASAAFLARERTSYYSSATTGSNFRSFSAQNSYIFASPISTSADGAGVIRITVFILDSQGLGVVNQPVELEVDRGAVTIAKVAPVTDSFGRAYFDVTSQIAGSYTIAAQLSGVTLPQRVGVSFR